MNAAGETALDVARRLKHSECEELVGGMREGGDAQAGERADVPGGAIGTCPTPAETPLTRPVRQLEQAQAGRLPPQIHIDYDWEPPQEFPYDSEDELEEKVPAGGVQTLPGGLAAVGQPWSQVSVPR